MPVLLQQLFVANKKLVQSSDGVNGTTLAPSFQLTNEWPVGDYLYDHINLDFYGNLNTATGGGAVVQDGIYQFMRTINFSTPLHGFLVENMEGILFSDILHIREGWKPTRQDPADTQKGDTAKLEAYLRIPFTDLKGFNDKETGLDLYKAGGKPTLTLFLGAYSPDLVVNGASGDGLQALNLEADVFMDPGPVAATDIPAEFMAYYGKIAYPVTATGTQVRFDLAFGGTVYKRVYVTQREGTNGIRRPNDVVGVSQTDRVTMKINSNIIPRDRISYNALQRRNEYEYHISQMPTGVAVWDFWRPTLGGINATSGDLGGRAGAKIVDALNVATSLQGTLEADVDVTSGNSPNPFLHFGYEGIKYIPLGARRAQPPANLPVKG